MDAMRRLKLTILKLRLTDSKWVLSWVLNLGNVFDSSISFGSAFRRTINRGTNLDNVDAMISLLLELGSLIFGTIIL